MKRKVQKTKHDRLVHGYKPYIRPKHSKITYAPVFLFEEEQQSIPVEPSYQPVEYDQE